VHLHLIRGSLGPHESAPRRHLDPFSRFCTTHRCERQTDRQTDGQTDRHRRRLFLVLPTAEDELPPLLSFLSSLSPPLPPIKGKPPKTAGVRRSAVNSAQPTNDLVHIGRQKMQLWWQLFLSIFLRTNEIFCTKTSLISYGGSNSSQGGAL